MLKIGEFSKLAHLTIKALRFYEKEGILMPAFTDKWTKYRFYETSQLEAASKIKAYRQLNLSIEDIKSIIKGNDERNILLSKVNLLNNEKKHIDNLLSAINIILEDKKMQYHVTEKIIPKTLVFYSETVLNNYKEAMQWIPSLGQECLRINPQFQCSDDICYSFCEYLDATFKEKNIRVRYNEAVKERGNENDIIKFREIPETKVLSIFHKGPYENISEAYAYIMNYAEKNNYKIAGLARECYIDGIWNKESPEDWLTEIQLPIE